MPHFEAFPILFREDTLARSIGDLEAANAEHGQHGPGSFLGTRSLPGILHDHDELLFFGGPARLLADGMMAV